MPQEAGRGERTDADEGPHDRPEHDAGEEERRPEGPTGDTGERRGPHQAARQPIGDPLDWVHPLRLRVPPRYRQGSDLMASDISSEHQLGERAQGAHVLRHDDERGHAGLAPGVELVGDLDA